MPGAPGFGVLATAGESSGAGVGAPPPCGRGTPTPSPNAFRGPGQAPQPVAVGFASGPLGAWHWLRLATCRPSAAGPTGGASGTQGVAAQKASGGGHSTRREQQGILAVRRSRRPLAATLARAQREACRDFGGGGPTPGGPKSTERPYGEQHPREDGASAARFEDGLFLLEVRLRGDLLILAKQQAKLDPGFTREGTAHASHPGFLEKLLGGRHGIRRA